MQKKKGISLIVLVITIIVIIILGTAVIISLNNNGIINRARSGVKSYNEQEIIQQMNVIVGEVKLKELSGENKEEALESTLTELDSSATLTKDGDYYDVWFNSQHFLLNKDIEYIPIGEPAYNGVWDFDETTQKLTTYNGDLSTKRGNQEVGEVIIPNYINGKIAKTIKGSIFNGNTNITKLTISNGIEIIENAAFINCINLSGDLIIPNSVITIGNQAFQACGFDGNLFLGKNIQSIGNNAFLCCEKLTGDLIIPDSVISIGTFAFWSCSSLNGRVKLSNNLTTVESTIFGRCSNLTGELVIPKSVINYNGDGSEYFSSIKFLNKDTAIIDHISTIRPSIGKIIGYTGSTAEAYAIKYDRTFEAIQ